MGMRTALGWTSGRCHEVTETGMGTAPGWALGGTWSGTGATLGLAWDWLASDVGMAGTGISPRIILGWPWHWEG